MRTRAISYPLVVCFFCSLFLSGATRAQEGWVENPLEAGPPRLPPYVIQQCQAATDMTHAECLQALGYPAEPKPIEFPPWHTCAPLGFARVSSPWIPLSTDALEKSFEIAARTLVSFEILDRSKERSDFMAAVGVEFDLTTIRQHIFEVMSQTAESNCNDRYKAGEKRWFLSGTELHLAVDHEYENWSCCKKCVPCLDRIGQMCDVKDHNFTVEARVNCVLKPIVRNGAVVILMDSWLDLPESMPAELEFLSDLVNALSLGKLGNDIKDAYWSRLEEVAAWINRTNEELFRSAVPGDIVSGADLNLKDVAFSRSENRLFLRVNGTARIPGEVVCSVIDTLGG